MSEINTLVEQLTVVVNGYAAVLSEYGRTSQEAKDAYAPFQDACNAVRASWLSSGVKECQIEFSGAYSHSESIYVSACVYDNADDLNELEYLPKTRVSCHAAAR